MVGSFIPGLTASLIFTPMQKVSEMPAFQFGIRAPTNPDSYSEVIDSPGTMFGGPHPVMH
jgi:hypothetical protein